MRRVAERKHLTEGEKTSRCKDNTALENAACSINKITKED